MNYATRTEPSKNLKSKGATTSPLPTTIHTTFTSVYTSLKIWASTITPTTSILESFVNFLNWEVTDSTIEAWPRGNGKHSTYPTASTLATILGSVGQIPPNYSFLKEPTFKNISVLLVKSAFLFIEYHLNVLKASIILSTLWTHMIKFKSLDFSPPQDIDLNYVSQTSVPADKSDMFLECAINYKLDLPSVIRYMGDNSTSAHQDINSRHSRICRLRWIISQWY